MEHWLCFLKGEGEQNSVIYKLAEMWKQNVELIFSEGSSSFKYWLAQNASHF